MNRLPHHPHLAAQAVLGAAALLALLACMAAVAAPASRPQATQRCAYGPARTGGPECMTKAEYDITTSRQLALDRDPAQYLRNALVRCERLMGDDRRDCVARIRGEGTRSGSVEGGGIYRELTTRVVGTVPPTIAPATLPEDRKP